MFRSDPNGNSHQQRIQADDSYVVLGSRGTAFILSDELPSPPPQNFAIIDLYGYKVRLPQLQSYSLIQYMLIESLELKFNDTDAGWQFHSRSRNYKEFLSYHMGSGVVVLKPSRVRDNSLSAMKTGDYFTVADVISVLHKAYQMNVNPVSLPHSASLGIPNERTPLLPKASKPIGIPRSKSKVLAPNPAPVLENDMLLPPNEIKMEIVEVHYVEANTLRALKEFLEEELGRLANLTFCLGGAERKRSFFDNLLTRVNLLFAQPKQQEIINLMKECALVAFHKRYPERDQILSVISLGFFGADSDSWKAWKNIYLLEGSVYQIVHKQTVENAQDRCVNIANVNVDSYEQYAAMLLKNK